MKGVNPIDGVVTAAFLSLFGVFVAACTAFGMAEHTSRLYVTQFLEEVERLKVARLEMLWRIERLETPPPPKRRTWRRLWR